MRRKKLELVDIYCEDTPKIIKMDINLVEDHYYQDKVFRLPIAIPFVSKENVINPDHTKTYYKNYRLEKVDENNYIARRVK